MKINEIKPNMLILECLQEPEDPDYGTCTWARFTFNLDRYELNIISDCGSYGYKWCETPATESFLHLMARVDKWYMLEKLCGSPKVFDYEETKKHTLEAYAYDEDEVEYLKKMFKELEDFYGIPHSTDEYIYAFENVDSPDRDYSDYIDYIQYSYSANERKIVDVFDTAIREKIKLLAA